MRKYYETYLKQHFIYNTLNCAVSLCRKNPEEASELLICLSECLHYTSYNNQNIVSLKEEIEFICSYLYVQSIRFNPRIKLICHIDKEINCNITRFSIYDYVDEVLQDILKSTNSNITFKVSINQQQKAVVEIILDNECKYIKQFPA